MCDSGACTAELMLEFMISWLEFRFDRRVGVANVLDGRGFGGIDALSDLMNKYECNLCESGC